MKKQRKAWSVTLKNFILGLTREIPSFKISSTNAVIFKVRINLKIIPGLHMCAVSGTLLMSLFLKQFEMSGVKYWNTNLIRLTFVYIIQNNKVVQQVAVHL